MYSGLVLLCETLDVGLLDVRPREVVWGRNAAYPQLYRGRGQKGLPISLSSSSQ